MIRYVSYMDRYVLIVPRYGVYISGTWFSAFPSPAAGDFFYGGGVKDFFRVTVKAFISIGMSILYTPFFKYSKNYSLSNIVHNKSG